MAPKLPASVKSLLKVNGFSQKGPSTSVLAQFIDQKKQETAAKSLNHNVWLTIASATAFTLNSTETVQNLYRVSTGAEFNAGVSAPLEHKVNIARIIREAGLKSITLIGVARSIINMTGLDSVLEDPVKEALSRPSRRRLTPENIVEVSNRGQATWDDFYEPFQEKLAMKLSEFHPDMADYIIQCHYGALLSNGADWRQQDTVTVGRALTSVVAISALRAQGGVYPQLLSHVFGLLKAGSHAEANLVLVDELKADVGDGWAWLTSPEGAEWVVKTVDELTSIIQSPPHL